MKYEREKSEEVVEKYMDIYNFLNDNYEIKETEQEWVSDIYKWFCEKNYVTDKQLETLTSIVHSIYRKYRKQNLV